MAELNAEPMPPATERELRGRIAELEQRLEARTQTVVALAHRLAAYEGTSPELEARLEASEQALAAIEGSRLVRYGRWAQRALAGPVRRLRRVVRRG